MYPDVMYNLAYIPHLAEGVLRVDTYTRQSNRIGKDNDNNYAPTYLCS